MLNKYEMVIVFQPDLDEAGIRSEITKIEGTITSHSGRAHLVDLWGRRQLAYHIKRKEFAFYVLIVFDGDSKVVSDLDRQLKINENVLRHLIVKKDKHAPDLSPRAREQDYNGAEEESLPIVEEMADGLEANSGQEV